MQEKHKGQQKLELYRQSIAIVDFIHDPHMISVVSVVLFC